MECWLCIRSQKDGFYDAVDCAGIHTVDECPRPTDKIIKLSEDNRRFKLLFDRMAPGLFRSDGGFSFSAIQFVFDLYQVPDGQRQALMDKVLIMIRVIQELRQEKSRQ